MADRIRINTERLGTDAGRVQGYIRSIEKEMAGMKQSVAVLETMWEGPGRNAFHQAWKEDMEIVAEAVRSLEEIYTYNTNAKKQYENCDRKVAALIADIRI